MPLLDVKFMDVDTSMTNMRIEMLLVNVKCMAVDCSSTNIKITKAAILENGHCSAAHVSYATFEMLRIERLLFNVKFVSLDSSLKSIKSVNLFYMKMAIVQLLARSH